MPSSSAPSKSEICPKQRTGTKRYLIQKDPILETDLSIIRAGQCECINEGSGRKEIIPVIYKSAGAVHRDRPSESAPSSSSPSIPREHLIASSFSAFSASVSASTNSFFKNVVLPIDLVYLPHNLSSLSSSSLSSSDLLEIPHPNRTQLQGLSSSEEFIPTLVFPRLKPLHCDICPPKLSTQQLLHLVGDLSAGLNQCHLAGWSHQDVSLSNIVCEMAETKNSASKQFKNFRWIDLGLARQFCCPSLLNSWMEGGSRKSDGTKENGSHWPQNSSSYIHQSAFPFRLDFSAPASISSVSSSAHKMQPSIMVSNVELGGTPGYLSPERYYSSGDEIYCSTYAPIASSKLSNHEVVKSGDNYYLNSVSSFAPSSPVDIDVKYDIERNLSSYVNTLFCVLKKDEGSLKEINNFSVSSFGSNFSPSKSEHSSNQSSPKSLTKSTSTAIAIPTKSTNDCPAARPGKYARKLSTASICSVSSATLPGSLSRSLSHSYSCSPSYGKAYGGYDLDDSEDEYMENLKQDVTDFFLGVPIEDRSRKSIDSACSGYSGNHYPNSTYSLESTSEAEPTNPLVLHDAYGLGVVLGQFLQYPVSTFVAALPEYPPHNVQSSLTPPLTPSHSVMNSSYPFPSQSFESASDLHTHKRTIWQQIASLHFDWFSSPRVSPLKLHEEVIRPLRVLLGELEVLDNESKRWNFRENQDIQFSGNEAENEEENENRVQENEEAKLITLLKVLVGLTWFDVRERWSVEKVLSLLEEFGLH